MQNLCNTKSQGQLASGSAQLCRKVQTPHMAITAGYDRMKEVEEFDQSKAGVKGLSDSGASTIPRIFLHPPESLSGLRRTAAAPSPQIPVIDLSGAVLPDLRPEIVRQIRHAASTWGFFQITNHGIPIATLNATVSAVRAFHELPAEAKSRFYSREETRGVMYASNNDLHRSEAASWHDSIQVWTAPEAAPAMDIPEICREEVLAWDAVVKGAADRVMELLAQGLGLAAGKFEELTFAGARVVVGHIYPFCPQPDLTLGIKAHTDPGIITILLQNEVQGLQVWHGEEWVDVKPVPGGLIVNIGDFLQIVSNGEYKSVKHRVLANGSKEPRISIVTFFNLVKWREDGKYGPLPELLTSEKPAVYRDFTIEEFCENFYSKELDIKSFVQKTKL